MFLRNTASYWNFNKEDFGMKRLHCFSRKNFLSLFGILGLTTIFHWYANSEILFKSLSISPSETLMFFTMKKIDLSSAKRCTFDIKLLGRSFTHIKFSNGPKLDSWGTPVLISSQWKPWFFDIYCPEKFWKSFSKLSETLTVFNLYIKPSYQTLSNAVDIKKVWNVFLRMESFKKIRKFHETIYKI